jgi:hypothetical protein
MNRGLTNVLLLAVLVGVGLLWSNRAQQASGQTETKAVAWEYKLVDFEGKDLPTMEKTLNELSKEGWEYVNVVLNRADAWAWSRTVFKRPRR